MEATNVEILFKKLCVSPICPGPFLDATTRGEKDIREIVLPEMRCSVIWETGPEAQCEAAFLQKD